MITNNSAASFGIPATLFLGGVLLWVGAFPMNSINNLRLRSGWNRTAATFERDGTDTDSRQSPAAEKNRSDSDHALETKVRLLKQGQEFLTSIPSYTAQVSKREVVGGELLDEHVISLKYRQSPYSVYRHYLSGDEGREVLYVAGANNGKLLAHDGGWKARLPAFWLHPDSSLAMRDTRYPVTMAGIQGLLNLMLEIHEDDLRYHRAASCEHQSDIDHAGRPCSVFTTYYQSPEISPTYRKSITWIDDEWNIPIKSVHFEWPQHSVESEALDDTTMIESYEFSQLDFQRRLTDTDFDRNHPEYRFH